MTIQIVVARYNENIEWIKQFTNVIIYNKGCILDNGYNEIVLDNVGKEGHTYYKHIYDNYDNLAEYTIFLQGKPEDHSTNIIPLLNKYINNIDLKIDFEFLTDSVINCNLSGCKRHPELPLIDTYEKIFDEKKTHMDFQFGAGAQFIVSKKQILKRSKNFYLKIINLLNYDINPIEGFVIERFHSLILNPYDESQGKLKLIERFHPLMLTPDPEPDISEESIIYKKNQHTQEYNSLYNKCYRKNWANGSKKEFDENSKRINELHNLQTLDQIQNLKTKWTPKIKNIFFGKMKLSELWLKLALTIDETDIALYNSSQLIHSLQCYSSLKMDGCQDERMLLFSLLHDIGKVLSLLGESPENVDGMNKIYYIKKGTDNKIILNDTITSFSHDEFGYYLLKDITPPYIYLGTRFHSCPEILTNTNLSKKDTIYLNIAQNFYEYDHDSKSSYWCPINQKILNECTNLIDKHFPENYNF